jgi:hypothetical protein
VKELDPANTLITAVLAIVLERSRFLA